MPTRPPSYKTYMRRYNAHTRELNQLAARPAPTHTPAHLTMTDAEIDEHYGHIGKTSRTALKREAAQYRAKIEAQKAISE